MVSPTAPLPLRFPRPAAQVGSGPGPRGFPSVSPPSSLLLSAGIEGTLAGKPNRAWPDTPQVTGSAQSLQEPGLCGRGVAQVLVKVELLQLLVTCCLMAGTPLLPTRGFAASSCPCSTASITSQPPVGTDTSFHHPAHAGEELWGSSGSVRGWALGNPRLF